MHPRPGRLDQRSARPPRDIRETPSSRLTILLRSDDTEARKATVRRFGRSHRCAKRCRPGPRCGGHRARESVRARRSHTMGAGGRARPIDPRGGPGAGPQPMPLARWPNSHGCEAAADVAFRGTRVRDQLPVISLSFAKNARLRSVLIPQFTGGD
jgi:hypothetical protein